MTTLENRFAEHFPDVVNTLSLTFENGNSASGELAPKILSIDDCGTKIDKLLEKSEWFTEERQVAIYVILVVKVGRDIDKKIEQIVEEAIKKGNAEENNDGDVEGEEGAVEDDEKENTDVDVEAESREGEESEDQTDVRLIPVYIGESKSILSRFKRRKGEQKHDAIRAFQRRLSQISQEYESYHLCLLAVPVESGPAAKLFESLMLSSFNFMLNTEENWSNRFVRWNKKWGKDEQMEFLDPDPIREALEASPPEKRIRLRRDSAQEFEKLHDKFNADIVKWKDCAVKTTQ